MAHVLVDGYLELRYAENCGAAFGILRDAPSIARRAVFGVAAVLASVALTVMFVQGRAGILFAYSAPMIVAGALGNLYDNFTFAPTPDLPGVQEGRPFGPVRDFIDVYFAFRDWHFPTFNVADSCITVGAVFLFVSSFFGGDRKDD